VISRLEIVITEWGIDEPRGEDRLSAKVTCVAAIKNQEHVCPSSFQVALDQIPIDVAELLSQWLFLLSSSSTNMSKGHKL
jgi:hypothetical protein